MTTPPSAPPAARPAEAAGYMKKLVDRFLAWQLPDDFAPDCYVSFNSGMARRNNGWPIGTNLLTAAQAEAMLRHVLGALTGEYCRVCCVWHKYPMHPYRPAAQDTADAKPTCPCCGYSGWNFLRVGPAKAMVRCLECECEWYPQRVMKGSAILDAITELDQLRNELARLRSAGGPDASALSDRFAALIIQHFGIAPYEEELRDFVDAALSAQGAAPPPGWKLVPVEPTPEMLMCGGSAANQSLEDVWRSMLEAAALSASPDAPATRTPDPQGRRP